MNKQKYNLWRRIQTKYRHQGRFVGRALSACHRKLAPGKNTQALRQIPVIINNFNRISYLRDLLSWLDKVNMRNIIILDNNSTFPPLQAFYDQTHYRVIRLPDNLGSEALWKYPHLFNALKKDYYIYTDPDVLPVDECPHDFIELFYETLREKWWVEKIGFSLKIDDLPPHNPQKPKIQAWEADFWKNPISNKFYKASIDTTFALYSPWTQGGWWTSAIRSAPPYVARHLPWYIDPQHISEEEAHYKKMALTDVTHW